MHKKLGREKLEGLVWREKVRASGLRLERIPQNESANYFGLLA